MSWLLFHHKKSGENPVMPIWVRFAAICLLLPAIWCCSLNAQAWGADAAPVVVLADYGKPAEISEAVILAHRILARESKDLLLDEERRSELAREIKGVLKRLRYAHPEIEKISARAAHLPGVLLLSVKPRLFRDVSRSLTHLKDPVELRTGFPRFDALNAKLKLRAVRPYRHISVLVMRLSGRANIEAARRAYMAIAGVEYAEPDAYPGDGPDIEAVKSDGVWHVVVRKAWGDCPSGCLYKKLFFFIVKGGDVERIEPARAMATPDFRNILEKRNWR
ncbi:MAG: hypothetical protein OXL41_14760 [Nitrospinae bacterium]|nr:hypothetical protein [Nitrospinota bacterium]